MVLVGLLFVAALIVARAQEGVVARVRAHAPTVKRWSGVVLIVVGVGGETRDRTGEIVRGSLMARTSVRQSIADGWRARGVTVMSRYGNRGSPLRISWSSSTDSTSKMLTLA